MNELILGKITLHMSLDRRIFVCITRVFSSLFQHRIELSVAKLVSYININSTGLLFEPSKIHNVLSFPYVVLG
jgi:hypothetical protein